MSDQQTVAEPIEVPTPIHEPNHEPYDDEFFSRPAGENNEPAEGSNEPIGDSGSSTGDKKKDDPTQVGGIALGVICFLLQIIVFVLTVIGTPLDIFRNKDPQSYIPDSRQRACFSMWGYKRCGPRRVLGDYTQTGVEIVLPVDGYICDAYRSRLRTASAFAIISIAFTLFTLIFVILAMCRLLKGFIPGIFAILSTIFLLISWACIVGTYYKSCVWSQRVPGLVIVQREETIRGAYNFGAGFGIIVAAFGVEFFVAIMLFFI